MLAQATTPGRTMEKTRALPSVETDRRVGTVLHDRYRVLAPIGGGSMGLVYRGEVIEIGRVVAIKFLQPNVADKADFLTKFLAEARLMSRLHHPHIIGVHD